jgi:hypothetical protein
MTNLGMKQKDYTLYVPHATSSQKIETNQAPANVMMCPANIWYITSSQMHHEMPLDVLEGGLLISDNDEECASYLCISCM